VYSELHITAAAIHADFADDVDAQIAHRLVFPGGQSQRRCHGHGVTGVYAECVDVFDGSDNNHVVITIAHELEPVCFTSQDGFFNQDVSFWRCSKSATSNTL